MKKGLLLSVVASTMIFAGGDIAPVEPAAPASADFWGQIGFAYQFQDDKNGYAFGDKENNAFSTTVVLGVEKELAYGFGFGAEVAGWTDFGLDIADGTRAGGVPIRGNDVGDQTDAEVSQAYLTYTFGNTAIKAGRQALPSAVSPWAWSDRTAGVLDITYDAVVIANTDITDTTLVGAWVANAVDGNHPTHLGDNKNGIFMLALINKSLANTTLAVSGYYFPDANYQIPDFDNTLGGKNPYGDGTNWVLNKNGGADMWSIWASAVSNFDSVKTGLQVAYVDGDFAGSKETFGVAGKIGTTWGDFDATLIAGYINDGDYFLTTAGSGVGTSAFWTDNEEVGDIYGVSQWALLVKAGYKLPVGKIYGSLGYWDFDDDATFNLDNTFGARLGYKFTVAGVNAKVEYRYRNRSMTNGVADQTRQRVRVEAYYKF